MKNSNMGNSSIFADNFDAERAEHESLKYGRVHQQTRVQYAPPDKKHSIEPEYGRSPRAINESV